VTLVQLFLKSLKAHIDNQVSGTFGTGYFTHVYLVSFLMASQESLRKGNIYSTSLGLQTAHRQA
jgi:hypothetical protein